VASGVGVAVGGTGVLVGRTAVGNGVRVGPRVANGRWPFFDASPGDGVQVTGTLALSSSATCSASGGTAAGAASVDSAVCGVHAPIAREARRAGPRRKGLRRHVRRQMRYSQAKIETHTIPGDDTSRRAAGQ
jgi:hypothetical protein